MAKTVRLVLALHNHQPVGNLDEVVNSAMEDAYLPFLSVMEAYPEIPFSFHISGCLFEWAEAHVPEYLKKIGEWVHAGRIEILGGGRSEPVFTMLPNRDAVGQIRSFAALIKQHFGVLPKGAWLPERVWEQGLVQKFSSAGVRYTVVDDFHLKRAGVFGPALFNLFLTEDQGSLLHLFPSCETLRYLIPFREPEKTIEFLRGIAEGGEDPLVVYADDGEKFGTWPGTKKHVYQDGWLKAFFDLLLENTDWIRLTTFSGALAEGRRTPRIYVPDASYREMLEWALPAKRLAAFRKKEETFRSAGLLDDFRAFFGGGFWRNFKVKYPEVRNLYARMMEVSAKADSLPKGPKKEAATLELYRGQCNCVYWHGVFGGLYLPHLRFAAYKHLLASDRIQRQATGEAKRKSTVLADVDFDGLEEVILSSGNLKAYLRPHDGGHLYELDLLAAEFNPLASMSRRFEDYHREVGEGTAGDDAVQTIHGKRPTKGKGVRERIAYDAYARESAVDHFFGSGTTLEGLQSATYPEIGDFHTGDFVLGSEPAAGKAEVTLRRRGRVRTPEAAVPVTLEKRIGIVAKDRLRLAYALKGEGDLTTAFGVEFNFAMLSGTSPDRYYYDEKGEKLGPLGFSGILEKVTFLGLIDEWQDVRLELALTPAASVYLLPVETVSQSESGFELLYQQSCVIPWWPVARKTGESFKAAIEIRCAGNLRRRGSQ
ncbi:MAG: alpha-amylase/4-alpha-glucanotransferase domain-containing protein [Planctomycetota bacterium]|jgi:alpha-amylase